LRRPLLLMVFISATRSGLPNLWSNKASAGAGGGGGGVLGECKRTPFKLHYACVAAGQPQASAAAS
jgi:hypothetical protein